VSLSRSARRVQEALHAAGEHVEVRELSDSTRTAPEAAQAVGCELGAIVKALVFRGERSGDPVLALVSGANRADEEAIAAAVGEPIGRATPDFVRERTGFAIGGVAPVGHGLRPLVDADLLAFDEVWAAAGTPRALFAIAPARLVEVTGGEVAAIAA
jgi:prolyl-tRNA editing enzyme YbaK/EbsC (Cys-tRNA(Pro) deacylase)